MKSGHQPRKMSSLWKLEKTETDASLELPQEMQPSGQWFQFSRATVSLWPAKFVVLYCVVLSHYVGDNLLHQQQTTNTVNKRWKHGTVPHGTMLLGVCAHRARLRYKVRQLSWATCSLSASHCSFQITMSSRNHSICVKGEDTVLWIPVPHYLSRTRPRTRVSDSFIPVMFIRRPGW